MRDPIDAQSLDVLFREARSHNGWQDEVVSDDLLTALAELAECGPTSVNSLPMRLVLLKSNEAKARIKPCLQEGNVEKTMSAPVVAIVAYDLKFWEYSDRLFPAMDIASWYKDDPDAAQTAAFRNSSLQGAYLILAARALGLDCAPMSGFDEDKLNAEFFPDGRFEANFIMGLGVGDPSKLHPKGPRLDFDEFAQIL